MSPFLIKNENGSSKEIVVSVELNSAEFRKMTDADLIEQLKGFILREKRLSDLILLNLQEMNSRRLYARLGYSSLFEFLVKHFNLSESSAYQRVNAMKLIQAVPEARTALVAGETNMSTMAATQGFIRKLESEKKESLSRDEKKEIFEAVKGKTQKEAQATFAKMNPIAALPANKEKPLTASHTLLQVTVDQETLKLLQEVKSLLSHEIPDGDFNKILKKISVVSLDVLKKKKGRGAVDLSENCSSEKKVNIENRELNFSGNRKMGDNKNIRIRGLEYGISDENINFDLSKDSHLGVGVGVGKDTGTGVDLFLDSNPKIDSDSSPFSGSWSFSDPASDPASSLVSSSASSSELKSNLISKSNQQQREPMKQIEHRSSKRCENKNRSRYVPFEIRRRVFQNANGRCEFIGSDGKRCESLFQLQIDHKIPWSQCGSNEESNLRCLCRVHNNFRTKETHGFWWKNITP